MTAPSRRSVLAGLAAAGFGPTAQAAEGAAFGFETVEQQAKALAQAPYDASIPPLPPALAALDYDAWRDIRFKPGKAYLGERGGPFRLQLFHRGFLYPRPVAVNLVHDGVASPIAYSPDLFDFGRNTLAAPLPADLGFAGIRVHYPLNKPNLLDELIVFVGASYFRFLGRDQLYGLSARGIALGTDGDAEEFPSFRAFWIELPPKDADALTFHALLDGPSLTGAYRFVVHPGEQTTVAVTATLYPRRVLDRLGIAPLTSMFFIGEAERGHVDDYRPELHDSDGLQIAAGSGEWLWRPLDNPKSRRISSFGDRNPKGFGLMQRDRAFEDYQDLEAGYERRPSYFVETDGAWGQGSVVLVELPTDNETADNIVAFWRPAKPYAPGEPVRLSYHVRSTLDGGLHPNARVLNTFVAKTAASGASREAQPDPAVRLKQRFLIDFTGGDLGHYLPDPAAIEVVASTTVGTIVATSITPNPHIRGFRAAVDVALDAPGATELRAYLRSGGRALSETWSYPWTAA
ncbi:glucan biosynthesis protein G [Methylobacterium brachythecii]|uniref:Glucans biosynthesis protein G n=1 Tax=Methylobacterium brachythecii TaxID=1176177 RepID=A0A7W6ANA7_9HYPH|nr:glucan biosynthesis protein G [Methylobacterium brachythecii]MBB3904394.1 glucans biosynthesis protein [Methylobacterium brachythecii]GLS43677.1 glucans biosynthesis protein G [Methylobacterium brachythecii]